MFNCAVVLWNVSYFAQTRQKMHDGRYHDGKFDRRHLYFSFYGVTCKPSVILVKLFFVKSVVIMNQFIRVGSATWFSFFLLHFPTSVQLKQLLIMMTASSVILAKEQSSLAYSCPLQIYKFHFSIIQSHHFQLSLNNIVMKDWPDKYRLCGTLAKSPSRSNSW